MTMDSLIKQRISQLDDRAVLQVLSEAGQNLREQLSDKEAMVIGNADDARAAVAALMVAGDGDIIDANSIIFEGPQAARAARELLMTLLEDPDARLAVEPVIENPPADSQKSPELAVAGAVILGALITWLQTAIEIEVNRKDGKLDFNFKLKKKASNSNIISVTAKTVSRLIGV